MIDIFISYSREDLSRVRPLVEQFQRRKWKVWWDLDIAPGKDFGATIEKVLKRARCVVVVWSEKSVNSRWVKSEAAEGADREILVPVLIDEAAAIPIDFKRIQTARLTDWDGASKHAELDKLLDAVELTLLNNPWVPQVDLWSVDEGYLLVVDIPGVSPDELEVSVEASHFIVKGLIRLRSILIKGEQLISERGDIIFYRKVLFPEVIEGMLVETRYEDGVLIFTLRRGGETCSET